MLDKMLGLPYTYAKGNFMTEKEALSSGLEDYIEAIYIAHLNDTLLKGAALARKLNVSRASVSEALTKLVAKGLVHYSSYEAITLTNTGLELAQTVYNKHHILKEFFEKVLNIPSGEAGENACKIEHIISQNILDRMIKFTNFIQEHPGIISEFKEEN